MPGPSFIARAMAAMPSTMRSCTFSCTKSRVPAMQFWPCRKKQARAAPGIACSRSASSNTTTGDLPPSSSVTFFRSAAAARTIMRPTSVEPVKAILSTPGCAASAAPALSPVPLTRLMTPSGTPASWQISARRIALSGASSAGFSTSVQPVARAGATLSITIGSGEFQGVIAPTTPIGSRSVNDIASPGSLPCGAAGMVAPSILVGQPA